jgi:Flp pilus assembly protein TadG
MTKSTTSRFARLRVMLRALGRDRRGLAMTEFAMSLPFLGLLGLGGLELTNMALTQLRVSNIALKTADNAARVRVSIDEADINEIFTGAKVMGQPIDFANHGRIILSSIEPVMNTATPPAVVNQYLRWQRCTGANAANSTHGNEGDGATGTAQAAGYGVPGGPKIKASANTATMLVEVVYDYQPIVSNRWFGTITMRAVQSIAVRDRSDQVIKNGSGLTNSQKALCSNTHAA